MKQLGRGMGVRAVSALAVSVIALVATGCGGGKDSGGGGGKAGAPVSGGSVTYALEAETNAGWCLPEAQLAISGIQVARSMYDTLTAPDAKGEIKPFLAESVTPNADATEWTIKLRKDVTFHDGTDLTAEVVKNNLDAYRGKYAKRSPLLFLFVFANVAEVTAVDPLTVVVKMTKPWSAFDWTLWGSGRIGILGQAQLDAADDCNKKLVGTGPFKLSEWVENDHLTVEKNDRYWQKDADGTKLPYLDEVVFRPVPEGTKRTEGLLAGEYDLIHTNGFEQVQALRDAKESGEVAEVESTDYAEVSYFMLNQAKPPFDNEHARAAFVYGVDRDEYRKLRTLDLGANASGPFAPGVNGYLEDTGYPGYDPDKAAAEVKAYKADTGKDLTFTISSTTDPETVASVELVQSMMKKLDVEVKLVQSDQATLIDRAIGGEFEANLWRNHPGADPDTQYNWWHSGSPVNFGKIRDPKIDAALDTGRTSTDPATRTKAYEDLNRAFAVGLHNVWLQWTLWSVGSRTDIGGVLGPNLPDGSGPFPGLETGHSVAGLYRSKS